MTLIDQTFNNFYLSLGLIKLICCQSFEIILWWVQFKWLWMLFRIPHLYRPSLFFPISLLLSHLPISTLPFLSIFPLFLSAHSLWYSFCAPLPSFISHFCGPSIILPLYPFSYSLLSQIQYYWNSFHSLIFIYLILFCHLYLSCTFPLSVFVSLFILAPISPSIPHAL